MYRMVLSAASFHPHKRQNFSRFMGFVFDIEIKILCINMILKSTLQHSSLLCNLLINKVIQDSNEHLPPFVPSSNCASPKHCLIMFLQQNGTEFLWRTHLWDRRMQPAKKERGKFEEKPESADGLILEAWIHTSTCQLVTSSPVQIGQKLKRSTTKIQSYDGYSLFVCKNLKL